MPTDPSLFSELEPSAARALAQVIDSDEATDPGWLIWQLDIEPELASELAGQIDQDCPFTPLNARALQRGRRFSPALAKAIVEAIKARG
jgi:hypothetical protein